MILEKNLEIGPWLAAKSLRLWPERAMRKLFRARIPVLGSRSLPLRVQPIAGGCPEMVSLSRIQGHGQTSGCADENEPRRALVGTWHGGKVSNSSSARHSQWGTRSRSVYMNEQTNRGLAYDPQDLERLLVSRENVGDVDGMVALYEPQALLDCGGGRLTHGREAIRKFY